MVRLGCDVVDVDKAVAACVACLKELPPGALRLLVNNVGVSTSAVRARHRAKPTALGRRGRSIPVRRTAWATSDCVAAAPSHGSRPS